AGEPFTITAVGAFAHLYSVGILVRLRRVRGRARKRFKTDLLCRLVEEHGRVAAFERRQRICASSRSLERVAAGLYLALEVASLSGNSAEILELVVVGLKLLVGDAPVLNRHVGRNKVLAVTRFGVTANLE